MYDKCNKWKRIWDKYWTDEGYFKLFDIGSLIKKTLNIHGRNDDVINIEVIE